MRHPVGTDPAPRHRTASLRLLPGLAAVALVWAACGVDGPVGPAPPEGVGASPPSAAAIPGVSATIRFPTTKPGPLTMRIYDAQGQLVRSITEDPRAGMVQFTWDGLTSSGDPAGSGVYAYGIQLPDDTQVTGKLVLVR